MSVMYAEEMFPLEGGEDSWQQVPLNGSMMQKVLALLNKMVAKMYLYIFPQFKVMALKRLQTVTL